MQETTPSPVPAEQAPIEFASPAQAATCSFNECANGHRWPPVIAAANCPGCNMPYVAVQRVNCPFCNEPTVRTVLRSDFVPRGTGTVARCKGAAIPGESLDVEMVRHQWQEVEAAPTETFEDRRDVERAKDAQAQAGLVDGNRSTKDQLQLG